MRYITLTGNPLSTNNIYRSAGKIRYMTKTAKARKEQYQWEAKSQWEGEPLEGDICVNILLYFGNKRRNDWDNAHKLSMDSLEGICYNDDSQITEAHVFKLYDKENPRIEISLLTDNMCTTCGKLFNTNRGLAQHIRKEHEED